MLIGLLTRPIAFILAEDMAVAYFMAQFPRACFPVMNGGDAAVLYCFVFLYIFFAGPESGNIESARMWRQVIAAIEKLRKPKAK